MSKATIFAFISGVAVTVIGGVVTYFATDWIEEAAERVEREASIQSQLRTASCQHYAQAISILKSSPDAMDYYNSDRASGTDREMSAFMTITTDELTGFTQEHKISTSDCPLPARRRIAAQLP